jgi:hypothetical protein
MPIRDACVKPVEPSSDLTKELGAPASFGIHRDYLDHFLLKCFTPDESFAKPSTRDFTSFLQVNEETTFSKRKVDRKDITVPRTMGVQIPMKSFVSKNGKTSFCAKCINVKGGTTSSSNFGGSHSISKVTNLGREANFLERIEKTRGNPVARTQKKFPLHKAKEFSNLRVKVRELPNISEEGDNKNVGRKNVVEKPSGKVSPPKHGICALANDSVKLNVLRTRPKLEAKIFTMGLDSNIRPLR